MKTYNEGEKEVSQTLNSLDTSPIKINIASENESPKAGNNGISKAEKFEMLNKVFLTNSSFNKHTKEYFITRFQIILILKQSNILNNNIISKTQADILLTKLKPNQNKYKFIDFMKYLTEICKYIFKEKYENNPKKYFNTFLDYLLNNYYECFQEKLESNYVEKKIDNNCTMNVLKKIIESNIEKHALKLLLSMYLSLKKLYVCYFPYENKKKIEADTLILNSMENFISFGKDFEIMPYMINEKNYVTYYNLLLKHQKDYTETINDIFQSINLKEDKKFQDVGHCFKLSTFILFLYHFSLLLYYKKFKVQFSMTKSEKPEDIEIILFFLQKLEHSDGISKYILKKQRTNENKFTFIPTNNDIEIALKELSNDKYGGKTLITNINDFNITTSMFNDDKKELSTIDNNNFNPNNRLNTLNSYENNKVFTIDVNSKTKEENSKNMHKGEEICKNSKNVNELINKQLIKTLNSTPTNNEVCHTFRGRKKQKNDINKTKPNINEKEEKKKIIIPILDLENFLNVNSEVVKVISERLDNLSEIYLNYSKINDKLAFNRMSFSSFLKFLKSSNILIGVPEKMKNTYRKMGERLTQKNINVSGIKTYNPKYKGSVPCQNSVLTDAEKDYKLKISQIVNANAQICQKISIGEASVIFHSLTNSKNFPIYTESIKLQFDKNSGIDLNVGDSVSKARIFDKKLFLENQQNVPGKMDFMLFIKSFELIASKLYPNETLNDAVLLLLNKKIFPILPDNNIINSNEMTNALAKLNNEDIKYFLKELSPVIYPLYKQYADENEYMKFSNFLDFYTQFELFPELITLTQMKTIFFALNEVSNNNNRNDNSMNSETKNSQIQVEKLDFNQFLSAFAITAMFFNYKNIVNDLDRLLYLCLEMYNAKPIQEDKLGGMAGPQTNLHLNEFLKNFKKKFEKKKQEEAKIKNEKEKMNQTYKDTIQQLDLQFEFNEDKENREERFNSFL